MEAIEFVTKVQKGMIKIPKKYQENLMNKVRVIILTDPEKMELSRKKQFKAVKLKTKGVNFDRDMANER
jgi:hypothetical protein